MKSGRLRYCQLKPQPLQIDRYAEKSAPKWKCAAFFANRLSGASDHLMISRCRLKQRCGFPAHATAFIASGNRDGSAGHGHLCRSRTLVRNAWKLCAREGCIVWRKRKRSLPEAGRAVVPLLRRFSSLHQKFGIDAIESCHKVSTWKGRRKWR